jgi:hypothetical protein
VPARLRRRPSSTRRLLRSRLMAADEKKEFAKRLVVLERNSVVHALGLGLVVVGPLLLALAFAHVFPPGILGFHLTIIGALLRFTQRRQNTRATKRQRQIRADKEGVFIDGDLVVKASAIADGFFQPRRQDGKAKYQSSVRLVDKRRRILFEAEMQDENEALDLLHALGLDPGSRRAEFAGGSPAFATIGRQFATIFGVMGASAFMSAIGTALHLAIAPFMVFLMMPLVFAAMWPSKITVGVDGVLIRWMWRKEFIPMSEIRGVSEAGENALRLHLRSGEERIVYTSMRHKQSSANVAINNRDAIIARIREAHRTYEARGEAVDATALVARGTQSRSEWLVALEKLARADGGYRQAIVRLEDLLRIIEDPAAPEDARVGAALVVRKSAGEEAKARVRIAAEASASPKLRVALDAAAAGTDETMEAALEDFAPEKERAAG